MRAFLLTVLMSIGMLAAGPHRRIHRGGKGWAKGCDFDGGGDFESVQVPSTRCADTCVQYERCTHYTWTDYLGGTCWLKEGAVEKADAFQSDPRMMCGGVGFDVEEDDDSQKGVGGIGGKGEDDAFLILQLDNECHYVKRGGEAKFVVRAANITVNTE